MNPCFNQLFRAFTAILLSMSLMGLTACSDDSAANLEDPRPPLKPTPEQEEAIDKRKALSEAFSAMGLTQLNWARQALLIAFNGENSQFLKCLKKTSAVNGLTTDWTFTALQGTCDDYRTKVSGTMTMSATYRLVKKGGADKKWPASITLQSTNLVSKTALSANSSNHIQMNQLNVTITEAANSTFTFRQTMQLETIKNAAHRDVFGAVTIVLTGTLSSRADAFNEAELYLSNPNVQVTGRFTDNNTVSVEAGVDITASSAEEQPYQMICALPQGNLNAVQTYMTVNKNKNFQGNLNIENAIITSGINKARHTLKAAHCNREFPKMFSVLEDPLAAVYKEHFRQTVTNIVFGSAGGGTKNAEE